MSDTITINHESEAIINDSIVIVSEGSKFNKIATADQYSSAGEFLKKVSNKIRELDTERKKLTKPLDDSKRNIMEFFRIPTEKLKRVQTIIIQAMMAYQREQQRIALELQAKADEEARKQREKLEAQAQKAAEKGKEEKADALMAQAEMIVAPVITTQEAPKVKGVATKKIWKFEIIDETQLPREYMTPDTTKIGSVVRATKGTLTIAGVRIYSEEVIAS